MTGLSGGQLVRVVARSFPHGATVFAVGPVLIAIQRRPRSAVAEPAPTVAAGSTRLEVVPAAQRRRTGSAT